VKPTQVSVLIVDDSASNRRTLTQLLESSPDVEVVGRASDGEEGLKQASALRPDVITLDLEMPRLDGFAFLRLLMATVPTPVIVISSYAHRSDVFKALELGAFDFIAKPARAGKEELEALRRDLLEKVRAVRLVRPDARAPTPPPARALRAREVAPLLVGVGASTGGPPAVQRLLESLPPMSPVSLLICQHMPPRFTAAFAERLDRTGAWSVSEAKSGDVPAPGRAFISPGGSHLVLARGRQGELELQTPPPSGTDKHTPSVDRLFESLAAVLGPRALGVVLTGMGADGARGARAIRKAGGQVWAEAEETAVIFGMPKEAIATGAVKRILPLPEIGPALAQEAQKRNRG
jgi:two-component system chemotaxis response regulator CheB